MGQNSLAQKVQRMSNAINNALSNPQILEMLAVYGYGEEKMKEGKQLLDDVNDKIAQQMREYGEQYSASNKAFLLFNEYYGRYMIIIKLARIALKDDTSTLYSLRGTGARNRSYFGWIKDARILYKNLLNNKAILEKMEKLGISEARVKEELQGVEEFETAYGKHLTETGEAQQSTKDRNAAIDVLTNWYSDFRAVARIALYEKPQLLETLGIMVKS